MSSPERCRGTRAAPQVSAGQLVDSETVTTEHTSRDTLLASRPMKFAQGLTPLFNVVT